MIRVVKRYESKEEPDMVRIGDKLGYLMLATRFNQNCSGHVCGLWQLTTRFKKGSMAGAQYYAFVYPFSKMSIDGVDLTEDDFLTQPSVHGPFYVGEDGPALYESVPLEAA